MRLIFSSVWSFSLSRPKKPFFNFFSFEHEFILIWVCCLWNLWKSVFLISYDKISWNDNFCRFLIWFLKRFVRHLLNNLVINIEILWRRMRPCSSLEGENCIVILIRFWFLIFRSYWYIKCTFYCWVGSFFFCTRVWRFFKEFVDSVKLSQKSMSFHIFHKHKLLFRRW